MTKEQKYIFEKKKNNMQISSGIDKLHSIFL